MPHGDRNHYLNYEDEPKIKRAVSCWRNGKPLKFPEVFYPATGGGAFFGEVGSFEEGYELDALYLGLDGMQIAAKYAAQRKIR